MDGDDSVSRSACVGCLLLCILVILVCVEKSWIENGITEWIGG